MLKDIPRWYGTDPTWFIPFDRGAFRRFGRHVSVEYFWVMEQAGSTCVARMNCGGKIGPGIGPENDVVTPIRRYRLDGVSVKGRPEPVPVRIDFVPHRYFTSDRDWPGEDFPKIYAGSMDASPHRFSDGALCLYYPGDPVEQRWTSAQGFTALIVLVAEHLFFEDVFRETKEWIGPQAAHGFPSERGRAA